MRKREKAGFSMYQKKTQGWVKHLDFILLDILCLHIAFILAYVSRHGLALPYGTPLYLNMSVVYTMIDMMVLIANSTMKNVLKRGFYIEMLHTVKHVTLVVLTASVYLFSVQLGEDYSRITFYLMAVYYVLISYAVRVCWKQILRRRIKDSLGAAVYFLTTSDRAEQILRFFQKNNMGAYRIQGVCLLDVDGVGQTVAGFPVTSNKDNVLEYLCDKWVDEVCVSLSVTDEYPAELINDLTEMGLVVHVQMEQMQIEEWQHQIIERVAGTTVRTLSMTLITPQEQFLKRTLDILGGIVGCILTLILAVVIGPMIYIQSPGPIFFSQIRVGKNGKKFRMYKFRSMYMDAEERKAALMKENRVKDGMMFKLAFDPRIIGCKKLPDGTIKKGIGNFIRDWSIDEFPQFFNVLKGDLSLCGTRPPTVDEWEKYELHHRARLAIKPGITGLWQISGRSNITDFEQVVELDKKYIREWSMGLDFRILLQTIKVVLCRDGSM